VRWNLHVVLVCISLKAKDVEHFLTYLLASCAFSFENCLFNSFLHLLIGLLAILVFKFLSSLFWILIPCQMNSWQRFFSNSRGCLFTQVIVSFTGQKSLLIWWILICQFLLLFPEQLKSYLENCCLSRSVFLPFSYSSYKGSRLTIRSFNYFELILHKVRDRDLVCLLYVEIQFSQHYLLERLSFLQCMFLAPLSRMKWVVSCILIFIWF
jgi:hypothetical protein